MSNKLPLSRVATDGPPVAKRRQPSMKQYPNGLRGLEFWHLACHVEPCHQKMPWVENSAEDYTDDMLDQRRYWADYTRYSCDRRTPNMWRYTNCYAYYLGQAKKHSITGPQSVDDKKFNVKRLQACRQIMEFEKTHKTRCHPCDMPATQEGRAVWSRTTELLRYTLYTRYYAYLGHELDTFEDVPNDEDRGLWDAAYRDIASKGRRELHKQEEANDPQPIFSGPLSASAILFRMEREMGLLPSTITHAIELLVHETPEDEGLEAAYELEVLVFQTRYQSLAQILYRDFVATNTLMRFDEIDADVVHIQAVIKVMILLFFNVVCHPGEYDLDTSTWNATPMLKRCTDLLNPNIDAMYHELHRLVGDFANGAEERFCDAWTALWIDQDMDNSEVQWLLSQHLATLGVKKISNNENP